MGDLCTWTNPPVIDPLCSYLHEGSKQCKNPGAGCSWEPIGEPKRNAACAPCAPDCTLDSAEYCVTLKPVVCKNVLSGWPPFNDCKCQGTPDLYETEEVGTYYICP